MVPCTEQRDEAVATAEAPEDVERLEVDVEPQSTELGSVRAGLVNDFRPQLAAEQHLGIDVLGLDHRVIAVGRGVGILAGLRRDGLAQRFADRRAAPPRRTRGGGGRVARTPGRRTVAPGRAVGSTIASIVQVTPSTSCRAWMT